MHITSDLEAMLAEEEEKEEEQESKNPIQDRGLTENYCYACVMVELKKQSFLDCVSMRLIVGTARTHMSI